MQICANVFELDEQILVDPLKKETAAGLFREEPKKRCHSRAFFAFTSVH